MALQARRALSRPTVSAQCSGTTHVRSVVDRRAMIGYSAAMCFTAMLPGQAQAAATSVEIKPVSSEASAYLKRRDEAAAWKCTGGMFDCDGDREEFAKRQWADFMERASRPAKGDKPRNFAAKR